MSSNLGGCCENTKSGFHRPSHTNAEAEAKLSPNPNHLVLYSQLLQNANQWFSLAEHVAKLPKPQRSERGEH
jgi:hypothetical protein